MSLVKVKLRDGSSIFRDASQDLTIDSKEAVEVKRTITVNEAIKGGALISLGTSDSEENSNDKKEELLEKEDNSSNSPSEDSDLTLTELRDKYPNISARSKEDFLRALREL